MQQHPVAKQPPTQQLEFALTTFQELTGLENVSTIELFDALPLYQHQAYSAATDMPRVETIQFRKRAITATVKPAAIVVDGKMRYTFAGTREQLVENVLRKMISEPGNHVSFVKTTTGIEVPSLIVTPSALRKRLKDIGHEFKISEIRQALDILGNTKFILTINNGAESVDIEAENAIIGRSHRTLHTDKTGERSTEHITLHPLVLKSIVERTYRALSYKKFHGLRRYGAQFLYRRTVHHFTGVDRGGGPMSSPYNIDLETILASSGYRRYTNVRDNIREVRKDLVELSEKGILSLMRPWTERLKTARTSGAARGPKRIVGAVWDLYVSPETANEIIQMSSKYSTLGKREALVAHKAAQITAARAEIQATKARIAAAAREKG